MAYSGATSLRLVRISIFALGWAQSAFRFDTAAAVRTLLRVFVWVAGFRSSRHANVPVFAAPEIWAVGGASRLGSRRDRSRIADRETFMKADEPTPSAAEPSSALRYSTAPSTSRGLRRAVSPPVIRFTRPPLAPLDMTELSALGSLPLRARRLADAVGAGGHRSRRKGASVEFADYRDYQPGDDLRRVDWRLYGRTDRLHVRDAHEETPLRVMLLLDVSPSMAYASQRGGLTKIDFARAILGALALLARGQRDACGIGLLAGELVHYLPPSASPARLRALWAALEHPAPGAGTSLAHAIAQTVEAAPRACLFVIASDFYAEPAELEAVARRLRFERHDVLALHVIDAAEEDFSFSDPGEFMDAETGQRLNLDPQAAKRAYRAAFAAHRAALSEAFRGCGFDYLPLRTDAPPLAALSAYLARRAGKA
jgi:uncharacterized protein (DUF58 family)